MQPRRPARLPLVLRRAALALACAAVVGRGAAQESAVDESRASEHFAVCDFDENGWLSFHEAQTALGVDKTEFRAFDRDDDGRLDATEFRARYGRMLELLGAGSAPVLSTESLLRGGAAAGPRPLRPEPAAPVPAPALRRYDPEPLGSFPTPGDLLFTYDLDASQALSVDEVAEALRNAHALLSAEMIVEQTDRDESGELEHDELQTLARMLADRLRWNASGAPSATGAPRSPTTGDRSAFPPRPRAATDRQPAPVSLFAPRVEPAGHFGRLDTDGSGTIEVRELEALLAPARSSVRASAIVSALDTNGDGGLSAEELLAALQG